MLVEEASFAEDAEGVRAAAAEDEEEVRVDVEVLAELILGKLSVPDRRRVLVCEEDGEGACVGGLWSREQEDEEAMLLECSVTLLVSLPPPPLSTDAEGPPPPPPPPPAAREDAAAAAAARAEDLWAFATPKVP